MSRLGPWPATLQGASNAASTHSSSSCACGCFTAVAMLQPAAARLHIVLLSSVLPRTGVGLSGHEQMSDDGGAPRPMTTPRSSAVMHCRVPLYKDRRTLLPACQPGLYYRAVRGRQMTTILVVNIEDRSAEAILQDVNAMAWHSQLASIQEWNLFDIKKQLRTCNHMGRMLAELTLTSRAVH